MATHPMGLEQADVRSSLGEPLRLLVPVRLDASETLNATCVQIVKRGPLDDIPTISEPVISIDRAPNGTFIAITTRHAVNEPALRLVVQAGCADTVTREFVFLLDPPIAPRLASTSDASRSPTPVAAADIAAGAANSPTAGARSDGTATRAGASGAAKEGAPFAPARTSKPKAAASKPATNAQRAQAAPSAPASAASMSPAVRAKPRPQTSGDRVRLVEPAPAADLKLAGTITDAPPAAKADDALKDEQARVRAALLGKEPSSVVGTRETELTKQLADLGSEIQALKKQIADESARNAALRARTVSAWWVYFLGAFVAVALAAVFVMYVQYRRMKRAINTSPWWLETRLRQEASRIDRAAAPAQESPQHTAPNPHTAPASGEPPVADDGRGFDIRVPTQSARQRTGSLESDFQGRIDTRIEVEELGATQAMHVLRPDGRHAGGTATSPESPLRTTPIGLVHTPSDASLSQIDFDLNALNNSPQQPTLPHVPPAVASTVAPTTSSLERTSRNAILSSATTLARPGWLLGAGESMSWSEAKQAQQYLREVAETIEQADAYVSAGQTESAASLLRRLVQEREAIPRAPWLMLMQLYRRLERRDAYDLLASKFLERFGRAAPSWSQNALPASEPGLDSDPELLQAIWAKWGSPDSMALLSHLLYDATISDERYFNLPLQRDLLNFVKICPLES